MRRLFGRVVVEHGKCILKYYLTGSRKEGYSITILQEKENETLCSKCEQITRSTIDAKRLCYKLLRGIVSVSYTHLDVYKRQHLKYQFPPNSPVT